jgi:uncharacterized protein YegP (UPF0339 family)
MKKVAKLASVMMLVVLGACATDDPADELDPACDDDAKCDAASSQGFEIFKGVDGKYYFHVVGKNGRILMRSQAYTTKASATKGVESIRTNGVDAASYKVLEATNGEYYVNLYAKNHEIIATSETYTRKFNAARAVDSTVTLVSSAQRARAASTSGARFQTFAGVDHESYFHLRAANGEVVLASEGYVNPASALKGIASVRTNGTVASHYELLQAVDGQWYFHLKAANNEVIAHGETYASKSNAQRALDATVALLKSQLVADPKPVKEPTRTLVGRTDLVNLLDAMTEVAAFGTSLEYFGFAEQAAKPSSATCHAATAAQAVQAFDDIVTSVKTGGDPSADPRFTATLITKAHAQMVELLGSDAYQVCTHDVSGGMAATSETYILSQAVGGPKLLLELGAED